MPFRLSSSILLLIVVFFAAPASHAAKMPVGFSRLVSGKVEILPVSTIRWLPLLNNQEIFAGDAVRTGPNSRAAILCADESQIKLHENTLMVFKEVAPSSRLGFGSTIKASTEPDSSLYEVEKGKAWLRNSNESFRFQLDTPAVTAAIRGTEFIVEVDDTGYSRIILLDGRLAIYNPFGELDLFGGEIAMARPGEPPTKQVLLNPEDAVQWALYYPGIISYRDLPLARLSGQTAPAGSAVNAYDEGDMATASRLAEQTIAQYPDNTMALTVLGFTQLQAQRPAEALPHFSLAVATSPQPEPAAITGYALTLYRLGDSIGAYTTYLNSLKNLQPNGDILGMAAFFSLMAGKPENALILLEKGLLHSDGSPLCRGLLAQMHLIQNRKGEADRVAQALVQNSPGSPLAQLTAGLTAISRFDLELAQKHLEQARQLDSLFIHAYVYLARLYLGAEDLDKAQEIIKTAIKLAPDNGYLQSINGFVQLGLRDYPAARTAFERAIAIEPSFGEPLMGLAMIDYAIGDEVTGFKNILSSTLLDPRISLYQSVLGKAFYRARAFDKALTTYEYAAKLDPNDPTPHLYRGIALTDLNRPGEAIQAINTSITKNDNRAVFRSKLMLDRDLAVRNFDIAKPFAQLGLGEWSYSKALTSMKNDPRSSSAHLFLSSAFAGDQQRYAAARTEFLLYRLLAPANQETFTLFNDYTPMFESPYLRSQISGVGGEWSSGNSVSKAGIEMYGGKPGLAWSVSGSAEDDGGLREANSQVRPLFGSALVKYEPTVKDQLLAGATIYDTETGDNFHLNDWDYVNSLRMEQSLENYFLELGYVHRFNLSATFIAYVKHESFDYRINDFFFEPVVEINNELISAELTTTTGNESDTASINAQQQLVLGSHTLMTGLDYYEGNYQDFTSFQVQPFSMGIALPVVVNTTVNGPDQRSIRFYMLDYWKPKPQTVYEIGISTHSVKAPRHGFPEAIEEDLIGARLGLNWQISADDVLRLAFQHYLNGDVVFQTSLEPTDVAGFPSWLNAHFGTTITEAGVAWERQWNDKTFSVLRLNTHQLENPQYESLASGVNRFSIDLDRYQARFDINRILSPSFGLWAQVLYKRLLPDDATSQRMPNTDFSEFNAALSLSYVNERGISFNLNGVAVNQQFHDSGASDQAGNPKDSETFAIANGSIAYEFPDKRGSISLDVHNIFDTHFTYELEPVALEPIYPARRIMVSLFLNF